MKQKESILIIDDDPLIRDALCACLEEYHPVIDKENALNILECVQTNNIRLIFMDIIMPEKEGLETLEEVRNSYPELPIVMISSNPDYLIIASEMGASDVLIKPIDCYFVKRLANKHLH